MKSKLKYTWNTEKSISKLKLLKELFLDNNGISTIRQKTFENNEQLEWLHLGIISTGIVRIFCPVRALYVLRRAASSEKVELEKS